MNDVSTFHDAVSYTHLDVYKRQIVNKYPYQAKILTSFMCNTIQATPGAMRDEVVERLCDPEVLPLHIVCDVFVGEHAQYADYIVPDVTPYESFGLPTTGTTFTGYGTTCLLYTSRCV